MNLRVMQIHPVNMCLVAGGEFGRHEVKHFSPQDEQQQARQPLTTLHAIKAKRKRTAKAQKAMETLDAGKVYATM